MPIKPEFRWLYPIDWRELSALVRFERARGRCQHCRRPHGQDVMHLGDGRWWDEDIGQWRNGRGQTLRNLPPPDRWNRPIFTTRVILACAHLDHDPSNSRLGNSQL